MTILFRAVAKTLSGPTNISEWILKSFQKLPGIVAGILIIISFSTCGALALAIGTIFYFFKVYAFTKNENFHY